MTSSITGTGSPLLPDANTNVQAEYQDVVDHLAATFPDKTAAEIHTAITEYIHSIAKKGETEIDPQQMMARISQIFGKEISDHAIVTLKKEWEEFSSAVDLGVADLAGLFGDYKPEDTQKFNRGIMLLLWRTLQKEIENEVVAESVLVSETHKNAQAQGFSEFLGARLDAQEKMALSRTVGEIMDWVGLGGSLLGAAIGATLAVVALGAAAWATVDCIMAVASLIGVIPTAGVSLTGTALLLGKAALFYTAAASLAVSALASFGIAAGTAGTLVARHAFGEQWQMGEYLGRGIAHLLKALGVDANEDDFAKWTSLIVQLTLASVAVVASLVGAVCSLGISSASFLGSLASFFSVVNAMFQIGSGLAQVVKTGVDFDAAMTQAQLLELQAMLEQLSTSRELAQELLDSIFKKIFEAMRTHVAESLDTELESLESITSMFLNKA